MVDLTDYEGGQDAYGSIVAGAILTFRNEHSEDGFEQFERWLTEEDINLVVTAGDYERICGWLEDGTADPERAEEDFQRFLSRQRDATE